MKKAVHSTQAPYKYYKSLAISLGYDKASYWEKKLVKWHQNLTSTQPKLSIEFAYLIWVLSVLFMLTVQPMQITKILNKWKDLSSAAENIKSQLNIYIFTHLYTNSLLTDLIFHYLPDLNTEGPESELNIDVLKLSLKCVWTTESLQSNSNEFRLFSGFYKVMRLTS